MNSSIHLCQSPLPVAPGRLSSATKFHVSLSHGSLISVPQSSKRGQLVSSPLHMNSRLHKFSEEREKKNSKVRGERGASLEMACSFLGAFSVNGKMKHKPILACGDQGSSNPAEDSVRGPDDVEIEALKLYAMGLSKHHPEEAVKILSDGHEKWQTGEAGDTLLMALVELLVYQEKFEEASKKIEVLEKAVERDHTEKEGEGEEEPISPFMAKKWKKFYLLKAIVESVNEATLETEEDRWQKYCRKLEEASNLPGPSPKPT